MYTYTYIYTYIYIYIYIYIPTQNTYLFFLRFFFLLGYHKALRIAPYAIQ